MSQVVTETPLTKIDSMAISERAKDQLRELHNFCMALGGKDDVSPPMYKWQHPFATLHCFLPQEKTFDEIRLTRRNVELLGKEEWRRFTPTPSLEEPPAIVVWSLSLIHI